MNYQHANTYSHHNYVYKIVFVKFQVIAEISCDMLSLQAEINVGSITKDNQIPAIGKTDTEYVSIS